MRTALSLLAWAVLGALAADKSIEVSFRPQDIPKKVASCQALNHATKETKGIDIHYAELNPEAERAILMVHGWPGLWHSWKYQIDEFKKDYHIIAPDNRGFGSSGHPGDVKSSGSWPDIVGDLVCVLAHAGVDNAICMGHDWGSQLCHQAARQRPDKFTAVVGIAVPYIPFNSGTFFPTSALHKHFPRMSYQVFLGETPELAAKELNADIRRTLRATHGGVRRVRPENFLADTTSLLAAWAGIHEIPPIPYFTEEEEDYWVEQYSIQGFKNTLQFYTPENQRGSWEFIRAQGNYTIPQPVLSLLPEGDSVADWSAVVKMLGSADFLPHVKTQILPGAHWVHIEYPATVNSFIRRWLADLPPSDAIPEQQEQKQESTEEAKETAADKEGHGAHDEL